MSSSTELPEVRVGRLGRPNGLKGFMGLYAEPEDLAYFEPGSTVHVAGVTLTVEGIRQGSKGPEVKFTDVSTREQAEAIRGNDVLASERRQLSDDEFWPDDLVGLEVRPHGGEVVGVIHGPAQDRLLVERDGESFEVPFVDAFVPTVDVRGGFVEIEEIEGLTGQ